MPRTSTGNNQGAVSLEAAIVVPVFLFMMVLLVQLLAAVVINSNVELAADQAADAAARFDANNADGQTAADDVLDQLGVSDADVKITRGDNRVDVSVTAQVPTFIGIEMTVTGTGVAPEEEFRDLGERS